ncbi:MAG: hypothetical protein HY721_11020 [Planctomycetes bacterium]|nr:hypothetical protein [Planctomycetota bacterium]
MKLLVKVLLRFLLGCGLGALLFGLGWAAAGAGHGLYGPMVLAMPLYFFTLAGFFAMGESLFYGIAWATPFAWGAYCAFLPLLEGGAQRLLRGLVLAAHVALGALRLLVESEASSFGLKVSQLWPVLTADLVVFTAAACLCLSWDATE